MTYTHGGNVYEYNQRPIDFSSNINPLGMPSSVKNAIREAVDTFDIYPDPYSRELRTELSEYHMVDYNNIVLGNGAADLIYRIALTIRPKISAVVVPTFSEYEKALKLSGSEIEHIYMKKDFSLGEDILDKLKLVDIVFICNPNNPTGRLVDNKIMEKIANICLTNQTYLVIDECFLDFVRDGQSLISKIKDNPYLIVIKAFTKIYAMAGIRLGYIIVEKNLGEKIHDLMQPWSVSTIAQVAGVAALKDKEFIKDTVDYVDKERRALHQILVNWGAKVFESECNYIFFYTNKEIFKPLLDAGILIRDCSNYIGLAKGYYRIAVKTTEENQRFSRALNKILI